MISRLALHAIGGLALLAMRSYKGPQPRKASKMLERRHAKTVSATTCLSTAGGHLLVHSGGGANVKQVRADASIRCCPISAVGGRRPALLSQRLGGVSFV